MPITTTTTSRPDIPLPAGFDVIDEWNGKSRLIGTEITEVEGTDAAVCVDARQLLDGSLLNHSGGDSRVAVYQRSSSPGFRWQDCLELTPAGARQLARALVAGADELDGLVQK